MTTAELVGWISIALVLAAHAGTLIWIVAKMTSAIKNLERITEKISLAVDSLRAALARLDTRVTVLERHESDDARS